MALTPNIRSSQAVTLAAALGTDVRASYAAAFAAVNFPTEFIRASESLVHSAIRKTPDMQVSQAVVMAAVRGAVANPDVRAWTFTLDGHDYYVLRLGDNEAIVYDRYAKQWYDWRSGESGRAWRANTGLNWYGGDGFAATYGSYVVVGDDTFGLLWFLDPLLGVDQATADGGADRPFERIVMGQVTARRRDVIPCYEIFITADTGEPAFNGAAVRLEISDDAGKTFFNAGEIAAEEGNFNQEYSWTSLGQIEAPGRLFRIIDNGAFARIDDMDMADQPGEDG